MSKKNGAVAVRQAVAERKGKRFIKHLTLTERVAIQAAFGATQQLQQQMEQAQRQLAEIMVEITGEPYDPAGRLEINDAGDLLEVEPEPKVEPTPAPQEAE